MALHIFNSLTKQKELFTPIDPANVRMYVCGMTVYDFCHVGHARVLVVFDVVYRYLCEVYGASHVNYVRNITDIDDKIIKRANENGESISQLTERFIAEMNKDSDALGVIRPNVEPRATEYIDEIVSMTGTLVQKGKAYCGNNGDVYYDVSEFPQYGRLAGRNVEEDRAGARVEINEAKNDPLDFVLWKAAKPGEPSWKSPWGEGRPGWHIECSAMATQCLGNHFDIHGGGMDLKFPHHENEIAQSEAATGEKFANVWMHNGYVMINEEKMSKSLGNFFTLREVLKQYAPETMRYFILASHYRSPLNYSQENLDTAKSSIERLYNALRGLTVVDKAPDLGDYGKRFYAALDDDFNTADAIAVLFDIAREVNRAKSDGQTEQAVRLASILKRLGLLLGLLQDDPERVLKGHGTAVNGLSDGRIDQLIQERLDARKSKNWKRADEIRDELKANNIVLEDGAQGTTWRRG